VRRIGVIGFLAIAMSAPAAAADANGGCDAPFQLDAEPNDDDDPSPQPFLTRNQCEAMEARELRAPLLEIPQEDEDPMRLSLGIKNGGLSLRPEDPLPLLAAA
jgi:hypothetical protein